MSVKVLVVDDSALVRKVLTEILREDPDIEVVGAAADPYMAREKIKRLQPDVLTLDVEMPRMDGITFLKNLMRLHPMAVIMVSSLTERGADVTLQALDLGAIDVVTKPRIGVAHGLVEYADELCTKVKLAGRISRRHPSGVQAGGGDSRATVRPDGPAVRRHFATTDRIVAIGASTGGVVALKVVLSQLPADAPPLVITQHIPPLFSRSFARRMNGCSAVQVSEARDGDQLVRGRAFIAPGDRHLTVARDGARYVCRLDDESPVNRHRPSVDVLFGSVARNAGANAVGVILTGMGVDGAEGLWEMHEAGADTVAQDEASSVVWGMPGAAVRRGAVDAVVPIGQVADRLVSLSRRERQQCG